MFEWSRLCCQDTQLCEAQLCTDCEEIVPKFRIERHKQSLCPKRRVKCPGSAEDGPELWANLSVAEEWEVRIDGSCGKSMCRDRLEEHFKKDCTRLAVKCLRCNDTVRGGGRKTYLELLDLHKSKCRQAAKPCPLGCGLKLCEGKMNRHVNKACPNLKMKCKWPGCSLTMSSYEYKDNAATHCGECGDKLDGVGNNMAHIVQDCKKFQPLCPMGCGDRHVFRELKTHLKAGQLKPQTLRFWSFKSGIIANTSHTPSPAWFMPGPGSQKNKRAEAERYVCVARWLPNVLGSLPIKVRSEVHSRPKCLLHTRTSLHSAVFCSWFPCAPRTGFDCTYIEMCQVAVSVFRWRLLCS